MGLLPDQVRVLTMKEFNLMFTGYLAREDRKWNHTRHIMSYVASFAGMGARDFVEPKNIWPLPFDKEDQKKYIKTLKQVLELINEFELAINGS
jgi:hypothetical protein